MERNIRLNWQDIVKEAISRRKEQGLTQEQLAILCNVSKPTLNGFEKGSPNITLKTALKILKSLDLA
jgi:DNA-binding XRE family transcriptional regulator